MAGYYLLSLFASLLFISQGRVEEPNGLMIAAQFTIYVDGEREEVTWNCTIDRNIYSNDCQAMYDLNTFTRDICDLNELQKLKELFDQYNSKKGPPENYNKL